jgi:hypothetical protein
LHKLVPEAFEHLPEALAEALAKVGLAVCLFLFLEIFIVPLDSLTISNWCEVGILAVSRSNTPSEEIALEPEFVILSKLDDCLNGWTLWVSLQIAVSKGSTSLSSWSLSAAKLSVAFSFGVCSKKATCEISTTVSESFVLSVDLVVIGEFWLNPSTAVMSLGKEWYTSVDKFITSCTFAASCCHICIKG